MMCSILLLLLAATACSSSEVASSQRVRAPAPALARAAGINGWCTPHLSNAIARAGARPPQEPLSQPHRSLQAHPFPPARRALQSTDAVCAADINQSGVREA